MHVLLVEDDADVATRYADALGRAGFVISTAGSGADAFKVLERQAVDAIVCDFTLPGEDGSTFFERLAERSPDLAERVLFVTGWSKDTKTSSLLELTGRPVLTKPVDLEDLTIAVRRLVGA
jgi:DNA-binding response OmpR family regulator